VISYLVKVLIVFPEKYSPFAEMMAMLTLVQTKKIRKSIMVALYGSEYWRK